MVHLSKMKIAICGIAILFFVLAISTSSFAAEAHDWKAEVRSIVGAHDVVLFSKSYCPYCRYVCYIDRILLNLFAKLAFT